MEKLNVDFSYDLSGLGVVRAFMGPYSCLLWRTWRGGDIYTGVHWTWYIGYDLYIVVTNDNTFDLYKRGHRFGTVTGKFH